MSRNALERLTDARPPALDENLRELDLDGILAHPRSASPRPRLRLRLAAGAAALTAATLSAVVVGVSALTGGPVERTAAPPEPTAQEQLLAAAEHTLAQPEPTSGRYWRHGNRNAAVEHLTVDGREVNVVVGNRFEYYDAQDGSTSYMVYQRTAAEPLTDSDAETLKHVDLSSVEGIDTADSQRYVTENPTTARPFGGMPLTFAQLAALPGDPAAVRSAISSVEKQSAATFVTAGLYLAQMPIRPEARAAIYRILAEETGDHALAMVTDRQGRRVIAITWDEKYQFLKEGSENTLLWGTAEGRGLIDPESGAVVGYETYVKTLPAGAARWLRPGQLVALSLDLGSGFTDEAPEK